MLKLKQKIALVLALILALAVMVPVQAEDLAERIREITQRESAPAETRPAPQQEDTGLEETPVVQDASLTEEAAQDEGQQAASAEEDELVLDDEAVSSRAAFSPDIMTAAAGTVKRSLPKRSIHLPESTLATEARINTTPSTRA